MEKTELRIGNWISNGEKIFTVDANFLYDLSVAETPALFCVPIPLTPEILEKAGLMKLNNSWIVDDGSRDEHGGIICGPYTFSVFGYTCTELKYGRLPITSLHQLQNLYFALTGTELNIQS